MTGIWKYSSKIHMEECQMLNTLVRMYLAASKRSDIAQSCPTLCDPVDCSLQGSSVHGIFQARVLEWVAISFSRGSSWPRDRTQVSRIAGRCFTVWATREALKRWADSNLYITEVNQPWFSLERLMLKPQYFGHLMRRANSLEKTLMLGKIEGRRRGWQRMRWLNGSPTQ